MRLYSWIWIVVGWCCWTSMAYAAGYTGQVIDGLTGEGIEGAELIDQAGHRVQTGNDGKFVLDSEHPEVEVRMPGFQERHFMLKASDPNRIELSLKGVYQIGKVEVKAKPDAKKVVVSKQHIEKETVKQVTTAIFPDVAKVVQMLPGVTTSDDFSSLLYVRGGSPNEVIAVLDNMIILSPYIWGGAVSVFNPNLVDAVDFSTGGFPAEWPQAMSAIMNVKNKVGNPERLKGFVDLGPASLDVFVEGPLAGNLGGAEDSSFLLGLRRTDYDLVAKYALSGDMVWPYFYDGQLKTTLPLKNGTLSLNSIFSVEGMSFHIEPDEDYGSDEEMDFHYLNKKLTLGISYDLQVSDKLSVMTLAGLYLGAGSYKLVSSDPVDVDQNETIWQIRNTWQWLPDAHHIVKAGFNYFPGMGDMKVHLTTKVPTLTNEYYYYHLDQEKKLSYYYSGAFVQDDIEVLEGFFYVNPGVNLQYYQQNNQWIANPRLAFKLKPDAAWETYFATGLYSQYPLSASYLDAETGNPHLQAEESIHYILGSKTTFDDDYTLQLEAYYKDYRNLIISDPDPDVNYTNNGIGHACGFDVMLQKKIGGNWDGWLTYSYVHSERKITSRSNPGDFGKPEETTPVDEWFPASSDRPHTLNLILNYTINPKWKLALTQKYCSGKPYTPVADAEYQPAIDEYVAVDGSYNSSRMPDYTTTDVKLSMPFFNLRGCSSYVQITNLFNVKNVDSYIYNKDYSESKAVYQLPFMLLGGIRWEY